MKANLQESVKILPWHIVLLVHMAILEEQGVAEWLLFGASLICSFVVFMVKKKDISRYGVALCLFCKLFLINRFMLM